MDGDSDNMRRDEELESLVRLSELSKFIQQAVVKKYRATHVEATEVSRKTITICFDTK